MEKSQRISSIPLIKFKSAFEELDKNMDYWLLELKNRFIVTAYAR